MNSEASKITIHMVSSLNGLIAKKDNSVSWFDTSDYFENGIPEENHEEFMKTIDCFVMGSKTYELALELGWPYGGVKVLVLSKRNLKTERQNVEIISGDLAEIVSIRLKPNYRNIWVVGGAMLTKEFVRLKLADEICLSVLPVVIGDGIPFLEHVGIEQALHLKNVKAFKNGMVELCYEIIKD